jgi:hypothetical protein
MLKVRLIESVVEQLLANQLGPALRTSESFQRKLIERNIRNKTIWQNKEQ